MSVVWTRRALLHLSNVREYIANDSAERAALVADRILSAVDRLDLYPELGRPGRLSGTRELAVARTPYIVVYRLASNGLEILAVIHGAQKWPPKSPA